ncbi:ER-golgi trafficking TRAPP I complex 85 kDa subunit-domain-containing protein [Jimgerdemannia flammicorona]|uniref:ER-golgi trafficking TRAPP I complex 85 kDa subunit-domain-containing protein n=1 Tax=Jimgerdemannia flammicorona TaxID=994334 RepID=A0A433D7E5_9FUNG|nr:ER-golgi trafficking TRAPP I complex 85 kDa subunit-domain-containing protein [Jimgerdemannia flammicorona]
MDEKPQHLKPLPSVSSPQPTGSPIPRMSPSPAPSLTHIAPRDFVARALGPRIAVIASSDANELCQTNNLPTFVELIKPFGELIEGKVSARDSQNLPISIDNFSVRFADLTQLEEPDHRAAFRIISDYVKAQSPDLATESLDCIRTKQDVSQRYLETNTDSCLVSLRILPPLKFFVLSNPANLDDLTPWYSEFRRLLFTFAGASEHETFDHPVAIIIAVSSANPDPINTLLRPYDPASPAPIFDKGFMDPNVLKYYVLIHDAHRTSIAHSETLFDKMKKTFGLHCHLLKLNSVMLPANLIRTSDPEKKTQENDDPFSIPSTPQAGTSPENDTIDNPRIRDIWAAQMTESHHIQSRLLSYAEPRSPRSSSSTSLSSNINASTTPFLIPPVPIMTSSTPTSAAFPSPTHSRSASASSLTLVSTSYSSISTILATSETPFQTPLQTPTTADGFLALHDPKDGFIEQGTAPRPGVPGDASAHNLGLGLVSGLPAPVVRYGQYLSDEDVEGLRTFVKEMVVHSVIPFMERNIQLWNEQVASARRGLTGRFFGVSRRFFGSGNKSPSPQSLQNVQAWGLNSPAGVTTISIYPHNAPEAQMRKLADYAFMLRDYRFAHSIYDVVKRDYYNDKAYKYLAGTQEMLGLCQLMSSSALTSKTDVDHSFELSVSNYLNRCKSPFYATRATIMYYEMLRHRKMYKEGPTALVRMTGEDSDLRSALFLEQAAHCFLRAPKSMVRKYAFHLVMAGHRFTKCGQREHAYRCYSVASRVFEDHHWSLVEDHIHFALGRQSYHLGELDAAVQYFLKLLRSSRQSAAQQAAYIREFLYIYKQYAAKQGKDPLIDSLAGLPIPAVNDATVRVVLSNAHATNDNEEAWLALEKELLEEDIEAGLYAGNRRRALQTLKQDDGRVLCAIGGLRMLFVLGHHGDEIEPVLVHIDVHNPMQVPITLNEVMLGCHHRISTEPEEQELPENDREIRMPLGTRLEAVLRDIQDTLFLSFGALDLEKVGEIILEPLQQKTITLRLIPRQEGSIRIRGLHYTLNALVHTFHPFHKHGKRLNDKAENRFNRVYAPDRSLDLHVTSPMPLLDVTFNSFPEVLFSGEVVQAVLEINNKGERGLTDLRAKMSHPSFFVIGKEEALGKPIYEGMANPSDSCHADEYELDNELFNPSVVPVLPHHTEDLPTMKQHVLAPGTTMRLPVWVRGDRIGKHVFRFLFTYQSEEDNNAISYRTLRCSKTTQVLPSLKINAFTRPSTKGLNEFILGIETENLQTVAEFELSQLSAASPSWVASPVTLNADPKFQDNSHMSVVITHFHESSEDQASKSTIPPRQTTFTYYRIRKIPEASQVGEQDASFDKQATLTPEQWTSTSLERLLRGDQSKMPPPPKIKLQLTNLSFVTLSFVHFECCNPDLGSMLCFPQTDDIIPAQSTPLDNFALTSRMQWRSASLTMQFPSTLLAKRPRNYFTLYGANDIDLALYWRIPNMQRHGHHYIIGINLAVQQNPFQGSRALLEATAAPTRAMYEATTKERAVLVNSLTKNKYFKDESPVKVMVRCADVHAFDFTKSGLCIVPVLISIKNCAWNKTVNFSLEMLAWNNGNTSLQTGATRGPHYKSTTNVFPFHWSGATLRNGTLVPDATNHITVHACFQQAGVYDVNRWRLTINYANEDGATNVGAGASVEAAKGYVQVPNLPRIISVVQEAEEVPHS